MIAKSPYERVLGGEEVTLLEFITAWSPRPHEPHESGMAHNLAEIERVKVDIVRIQDWTVEQAELEAAIDYDDKIRDCEQFIAKMLDEINNILVMAAKLDAWKAPTAEQQELKAHVERYLQARIATNNDMIRAVALPEKFTGEEYKARQLEDAERHIHQYTAAGERERQLYEDCVSWNNVLRASLQHEL